MSLPGPWKAVETTDGIELIDEQSGLVTATIVGSTVQARNLIERAPQIAASLARCIELMAPYADEDNAGPGSFGEAVAEARATLAKAGGAHA